MVAKSFQSMTQVGEPYSVSGKMYVNVKNENTGTIRKVRWYTESEYAKMYSEETFKPNFSTQKQALGFDYGYITIFKGDTYSHLEWFRKSVARYCKWWDWYVVSTDSVPFDLPIDLEPIKLPWELVGEPEGMLKPDHLIKQAIDSLIYDAGISEFQGTIGDRLDLEVTIVAANKGESYYGVYTVHYMEDADGNRYLWNTGSKSWKVGDQYHIKGTVKDHKIIKNVKTTILTRCAIVK